MARSGGASLHPWGPSGCNRSRGGRKTLVAHIQNTMKDLLAQIGNSHAHVYLVGGSWRAIARLDMERRAYPMTVLHEYRMTPKNVFETCDWIEKSDLGAMRARTGTSEARLALVPLATLVLRELVRTFHPETIDVSSYGIREGLLYEQMPEKLRRRDPLLESCRHAERTMARMPGSGKKLFNFLTPLYHDASPALLRMVKAACLLHDTTWRAHPDYRAEVCFDNATRANLGGLSHSERVFLGLSLLHRYKSVRTGSRLESLFSLLDENQMASAEVLGRAMRFGAMFAFRSLEDAGALEIDRAAGCLKLKLEPLGGELFGEVAEARFASLASALNLTPAVIRPDTARPQRKHK